MHIEEKANGSHILVYDITDPPYVPRNVKCVAQDKTHIKITWSALTANKWYSYCKIHRSINNGPFLAIGIANSVWFYDGHTAFENMPYWNTPTSYVDIIQDIGIAEYRYTVQTINQAGTSANSDIAVVTSLSDAEVASNAIITATTTRLQNDLPVLLHDACVFLTGSIERGTLAESLITNGATYSDFKSNGFASNELLMLIILANTGRDTESFLNMQINRASTVLNSGNVPLNDFLIFALDNLGFTPENIFAAIDSDEEREQVIAWVQQRSLI